MSLMYFLKLEEVEELLEEGMLGALWALGEGELDALVFGNGSSSGCHGGLWWLIEDEEDGEVVAEARSRMVQVDLVLQCLGKHCKSIQDLIRFREYGLSSIEWVFKDLTRIDREERVMNSFFLNHVKEIRMNAGVIS
ncbi:hypothetical protein Tco_1405550 [Tanacetum coccineum]